MKIEHIGYTVESPFVMAKWYEKNFDFEIKRTGGNAEDGMVFLSDRNGTVIEILKSPEVKPISALINNNSQLHMAFKSENPYEDSKKLEACGATFVGKCPVKVEGDVLLMLKDPWGNVIQLAKRGKGNEIDK